jgi:hypothetical protein
MNLCEPPHLPVGTRRTLRYLSLLLLPALAPKAVHSLPRSTLESTGPESVPYLPALGAPPLRWQPPVAPPKAVARPAMPAPPTPVPNVAIPESEPSLPALAPPVAATPPQEDTVAESRTLEATAPAKPPPPAILPDDARPPVRAEDFLPYFQPPGFIHPAGNLNVIVPGAFTAPAPGPLPPSSATYTQTPQ